MDITYSNTTGIKIVAKALSLTIDPAKEAKSDVVLFSQTSEAQMQGLTVFDGPGEYEVKGCMIDGIKLEDGKTAYQFFVDDVHLAFLPSLPENGDKSVDNLSGSDVLFVSLKGAKAEQAGKLVAALEPRVVIPTDYSPQELKAFLDEMGAKDTEAVEKLKLQRKDLPEGQQEIVVLKG